MLRQQAGALFAAGRYLNALAFFAQLLERHPDDALVLTRCASCLFQLGEWRRAEPLFEQALTLDPNQTEAVRGLAILHAEQGAFQSAFAGFLRLNRIEPGNAITLQNIGIALNRLERFADALSWLGQAVAISPDFADAWIGLAAAHYELGQTAEAVAAIEHAVASQPSAALPRLMQALCCLPSVAETALESQSVPSRFLAAVGSLAHWSSQDPAHCRALGERVGDRQPFLLAYRPGNHRTVLSEYGDLIASAASAYWQERGLFPALKPPVRARPRLAILCAHIRRHSVWTIILKGLVRHLLRTRFELVIYHTGTESDDETRWAERHAERFVSGSFGAADWLRQIRADAPDVLYLPEVGMDPLTCKLGALRLAPLQVASWGHPITTGLPEIDLFFSGDLLEPANGQDHYRERLIRLPGIGVCTEWPQAKPAPLPPGYLRPRMPGRVRLLLCQHPFKYEPADMVLLAEVLRACDPCELYGLKYRRLSRVSDLAANLLRQAVIDAGLDADALLIERPWVEGKQFLSVLGAVDLYLDLPAFSGYTTAWQAVHCGLPLVTLEGECLRQRLAAGLLRQIGQTDTIAQDRAAYVRIAARLAEESRDPVLREARHAGLIDAATQADHQVAGVRAFEDVLLAAL